MSSILGLPTSPRFNVYDIRKDCDNPPLCYDFSEVDRFLALEKVRAALGVGNREWTACNTAVHTFLLGDWMNTLANDVAYLLDNDINVLVYNGDKDFICNWRGGEAWTNALKWSRSEEFLANEYLYFKVNDKTRGLYKTAGPLTFLKVRNAGHMVPMD